MPGSKCVVIGCKNSNSNKYCKCTDTLFRFPADETRAKKWVKACNREDLLDKCYKLHSLSFRVCSLHFEPTFFTSGLRNRLRSGSVPTIFPEKVELSNNSEEHIIKDNESRYSHQCSIRDNYQTTFNSHKDMTVPHTDEEPKIKGVPTVFLTRNDTDQVVQNPLKIEMTEKPEEYKKCRTCLSLTNEATCRDITENCSPNKSIMETIILLVPQMALTLKDSDVVCDDCFQILESIIKFISKCLEVEETLTNIKVEDVLYEQSIELDEYSESVTSKIEDSLILIDSECDYSVESKSVSDLASSNNTADENPLLFESVFIKKKRPDIKTTGAKSSKRLISSATKPRVRKTYKRKVAKRNETESGDEGSFSCTVCSEHFISKTEYKTHQEIHLPHVCEICGKSYLKKDSLRAHKVTHRDPNTFICEICGKGCKEHLALMRHKQIHAENESFPCDKCSRMFKRKDVLANHVKYVHNRLYKAQCPHCGVLSQNQGTLKYHINLVHLKVKPHECTICEKRFGRRDYLLQHLESHSVKGQHSDSAGPARRRGRYRGYSRQRKRTKVIVNKKYGPVPCKFCGKVIEGEAKLEVHLSRHINRYKCKVCPQTFVAKCKRDEHETVHENTEFFFRCNVCYKKFKTKDELEVHAATQVHRRPPRYKCEMCGQKFHRRFTLSQHTLTEHIAGSEDKKLDELVYEDVLQNNEPILNGPINRIEDKNSDKPVLQSSEDAEV